METSVIHIRDRKPGDIYIGRAGHGEDGYFGNPISKGRTCPICSKTHVLGGDTLPCYRIWLFQKLKTDAEYRARVRNLIGKRLACFCHPSPCHGDILAKSIKWISQLSPAAG